ncbi:RNA methyltransferase [bacterium]|nr:RNA methyltransferase [candidate division CSSED10-310 bacterium]
MEKILTRFQTEPAGKHPFGSDRFPVYVLLENIRSLHNVGSVFRTSDAARIEHLFLTGITGFPPRREISKTALGAEKTVPFTHAPDPLPVIDELKRKNVQIIAVEHTRESTSLFDARMDFPVCFVFGYEIEGIMQPTLDRCHTALQIPMFGHKGSVNIAVACGIVLFEAVRRLLNNPAYKIDLDSACHGT